MSDSLYPVACAALAAWASHQASDDSPATTVVSPVESVRLQLTANLARIQELQPASARGVAVSATLLALSNLHCSAALTALLAYVDDESALVRFAAARGLRRINLSRHARQTANITTQPSLTIPAIASFVASQALQESHPRVIGETLSALHQITLADLSARRDVCRAPLYGAAVARFAQEWSSIRAHAEHLTVFARFLNLRGRCDTPDARLVRALFFFLMQ